MPRLCKDTENEGEICKKLIEKKICMNASKGIKCKANWGEAPGVISEERYQEILTELGLGKAAPLPNHSHNANVGSKPKQPSVKVVGSNSKKDEILQLVNKTDSLELLIPSEVVRDSCNDYAESLESSKARQKIVFELFETVTTDNFYTLLRSLRPVITPDKIQSFRSSIAAQSNHPYLGYIVIKELYNFAVDIVKSTHHQENGSYKLLTDKNVLVTENIEELQILNMDRLYDNFTDFNYFDKSSASTSLVFTAKLKDLDDQEFIKKKTTLQPDQTFYFKAFPVGPTVNYYGHNITYPTEGLQTELTMYEELFKLEKYNITPNILCKITVMSNIVGFGEFLDKTKMLAEAEEKTFDKINPRMRVPSETIWNKVSIISTHPGGPELFNVFQNLLPAERKQVMFQIIYNLYVFDELEISQGDMHALNIKVNMLSQPVSLRYSVDGLNYSFQTKYLVKFFDFDFGMIGKTTTLKFDYGGSQTDVIREIVNPIRSEDNWRNRTSAITDIYNPNLDIVKLFMNSAVGLTKMFRVLNVTDTDFINFVKETFSGIYSTEKISETYLSLSPADLEDAVKIYGTKDMRDWDISKDILDSTWADYFKRCGRTNTGYIVKDFSRSIANNQLWVPYSIIHPKYDMLMTEYFNEFVIGAKKDIDITKQIVYTIDNMIVKE